MICSRRLLAGSRLQLHGAWRSGQPSSQPATSHTASRWLPCSSSQAMLILGTNSIM